jgi:hypothetical protein
MKPGGGVFVAARSQVDHRIHQSRLGRDQPDERPRALLHRHQNILMPHWSIVVRQLELARFAQPFFNRRQRAAQGFAEQSPGGAEGPRVSHVESELVARPSETWAAGRPHDHGVGGVAILEPGRIAEIDFAAPSAKTFLQRERHVLPAAKIFRLALLRRGGPRGLPGQKSDLFDVHIILA